MSGSGRRRDPRALAALAGAICLEVASTLGLRAANETPWLFAPVALGYAGSFAMLALVLRLGMPVGLAYGIWSATGVVATAALAAVLFGEAVDRRLAIGFALVVAGVLLVELGSRPVARDEEGA